jgi:competence protein ComGC
MRLISRFQRHVHQARLATDQSAFTIVELMIATLVFAVILLVITAGVTHFTTDYYRGINNSTTQTLARSVTDQISQAIQFSGAQPQSSDIGTGSGVVCVGNQEFYYNLGKEIKSGSDVALHQFTIPKGQCFDGASGSGSNAYNASASGYSAGHEVLQTNMRLTQFRVEDDGTDTNTYTITIGLADGDDDLFCAPDSVPNSCTSNATLTDFTVSDLACRSQAGSQFCDVVNLLTNAQARIGFGG